MQLGRLWRTVRYLTLAQWGWRLVCRGRRVTMRLAPEKAHRRIAALADTLPWPDPLDPRLRAMADPVLRLQRAVHGDHPDRIAQGRFTLLNRDYDFGSVDRVAWRGEFHEGNNPLRRMTLAYFGWAVPLLARGRADHLAVVCAMLRSLEAQNPFGAPGVFRDVWNAYTASHRLINLLCGLALWRAAGGVPAKDDERAVLAHARFCAAFVCANLERDLQYNHLMKNHVALALYAATVPDVPPALAFLADAVPRSLAQNVLPDGGHAERSPMYHALAMLDVAVLRASGLFPDRWAGLLDDTAARMADALGVMSHPDGDIALFNDAWLGEAPPARTLTGDAGNGGIARLPVTGYARIGDGADAVIFDCGPCGPDDNPGHAHADFLSVEASVAGRRFIVDPGVPTYTAGEQRDRSRSAASHNAPALEGEEPIEFWKSFRVGRRGRAATLTDARLAGVAPLWCAGFHNGYAHLGNEMRRWVGLWPDGALLICDLCRGKPALPESCNFLIDSAWTAERAGAGTAFAQGETRIEARALLGRLRDVQPARHWPRFGVEAPAHLLTLYPENAGPYRRAALWFAWGPVAPPAPGVVAGLLDRLVDAEGAG